MTLLRRLGSILAWMFHRRRVEQRLDEELRAFVDLSVADKIRDGVPPADARRLALLELGGIEQTKEHVRVFRHGGRLDSVLGADFRAALRRVRRSPALSLTVMLLVALTIGSATVVFSIVNAVLLAPLPFGDPHRLALVWETRSNTSQNVVGGHEFPEWARSNHTFDALSAMIFDEGVHLTGAGDPMALLGVRVSGSFFRAMGVTPSLGRAFSADEDASGRGRVVVISDRLWRARFDADRNVIGRSIQLNDQPMQIVGVMPPSFTFPPASPGVTPDLWTPIAEDVERYLGRHYLLVVGRLRRDATMAQAQTDLSQVAATLAAKYPADSGGHGVNIVPLQDSLVKDVRPSLLLLLGAVTCLVLIGCSNVAGLLLARSGARRRALALELAMGATRGRMARQLVIESLILSCIGGACGVALAATLVGLAPVFLPPGSLTVETIAVDRAVLAFAIGVSALTGLVFGVAPALQVRAVSPLDAMRAGGRSLVGVHTRTRRVLVTAQVALVVVLLLGASLMARGLFALQRVDPGFNTSNTLAVDLSLRGPSYRTPIQQRAFFDAVEDRMRRLPGVTSVGSVNTVPLSSGVSGISIDLEGRPSAPGEDAGAQYRVVTPGYFKTLGVAFAAGRDFQTSDARLALPLIRWYPQQPVPEGADQSQAPPVAIINETMAKRYWPEGAIDRRFKVLFSPWITVIGVVRDMRTVSLRSAAGPEFYLSATQEPQTALSLLVRTIDAPMDLAPALRSAVWSVDPGMPVAAIRSFDEIAGDAFGRPRFMSALLGTFAGIALFLLTVGVYGLLAFTTAQRLPEFGVRVALGATQRQVQALILRDAMVMTAIGVAAGLATSLGLGRLAADQFFGVTPTDPPTLLFVALFVIGVVVCACWRPLRRAGRVDPAKMLREG